MSSGRRQAVGATRRRNRHIAHKRYCNALQGRTAQRGAHCRIGDSGGGHVCGVLPARGRAELPSSFPGKERAKLSRFEEETWKPPLFDIWNADRKTVEALAAKAEETPPLAVAGRPTNYDNVIISDAQGNSVHYFHDEDAALEYAIRNQRDRRNLTGAEILRCVQVLDKRHSHGAEPGGRGNQYTSGKASAEALPPADVLLPQPPANGKSAAQTAALLGVSRATIERARTVNDHAPEPVKQAVENGEMSIRKAAEVTQVARRRPWKSAYGGKSLRGGFCHERCSHARAAHQGQVW